MTCIELVSDGASVVWLRSGRCVIAGSGVLSPCGSAASDYPIPLIPSFRLTSSFNARLSALKSLYIPCDTLPEMLTRFSLRALRAHTPSAALAQRLFAQTSALAPHISRATQNASPQSSRWLSNQTFRRPAPLYHPVSGLRPSTRRAFASTPHPNAQYNRSNQYNRFNKRGSLFYTLIQNSRPHHFVIIGIGLSGIYLYNTDVVSVSQPHPDFNPIQTPL